MLPREKSRERGGGREPGGGGGGRKRHMFYLNFTMRPRQGWFAGTFICAWHFYGKPMR